MVGGVGRVSVGGDRIALRRATRQSVGFGLAREISEREAVPERGRHGRIVGRPGSRVGRRGRLGERSEVCVMRVQNPNKALEATAATPGSETVGRRPDAGVAGAAAPSAAVPQLGRWTDIAHYATTRS